VVPTISRFRGIKIEMFFNEGLHGGRPHFHARYGRAWASYDLDDLSRLAGELPPSIERLVREWAGEHGQELLENWERARRKFDLRQIAPLK
jgi:glutamate synthase domain-containing protein 3